MKPAQVAAKAALVAQFESALHASVSDIEAAILSMKGPFTALDVYAALPHAERARVVSKLNTMVDQGQIRVTCYIDVDLPVDGEGRCGKSRRIKVRRFVVGEQPAAVLPRPTEPVTTGRRVLWEDGARALAWALAAWPGSPLPEEYAL